MHPNDSQWVILFGHLREGWMGGREFCKARLGVVCCGRGVVVLECVGWMLGGLFWFLNIQQGAEAHNEHTHMKFRIDGYDRGG